MEKERRIPTEIYSRVSGYFRPVNQFNPGKQAEFFDRKKGKIERIKEELALDKKREFLPGKKKLENPLFYVYQK